MLKCNKGNMTKLINVLRTYPEEKHLKFRLDDGEGGRCFLGISNHLASIAGFIRELPEFPGVFVGDARAWLEIPAESIAEFFHGVYLNDKVGLTLTEIADYLEEKTGIRTQQRELIAA